VHQSGAYYWRLDVSRIQVKLVPLFRHINYGEWVNDIVAKVGHFQVDVWYFTLMEGNVCTTCNFCIFYEGKETRQTKFH
jgi:hypothetical protein